MMHRTMILAAAFALAAACHGRKETAKARADPGLPPPAEPLAVADATPAGQETADPADEVLPEPAAKEATEAEEAEDVVAEAPPEIIGTEVTARVDSVSLKKKRVVFRIEEGREEVLLQAGREIPVPFMDLELLTGMPREEAIEALEQAGDVRVRVFGEGDSMRIIEIELEGT